MLKQMGIPEEKIDPSKVAGSVPKFVLQGDGVEIVGHSGDVTVGQAQAALGDTLDKLNALDPRPGMTVTIDGGMLKARAPSDLGASLRGDTMIDIRSDVISGANFSKSGWMPTAQHTTVADYVLTHEWGHAVEPEDSVAQVSSLLADHPDWESQASRYGRTDEHELFAEMYAEYRVSEGLTRNELAQAFAEKFGWAR